MGREGPRRRSDEALLVDRAQHQHVLKFTVDQRSILQNTPSQGAGFPVEHQFSCLAHQGAKFNARKSRHESPVEGPPDERFAKPAPAKLRHDPHAQYPAVGLDWPADRDDFAQANNLTARQRDELRMAGLDTGHAKFRCGFDWRPPEDAEIAPFARHMIDRQPEAWNVCRSAWGDCYIQSATEPSPPDKVG